MMSDKSDLSLLVNNLSPTTDEVNAIALDVCLSVKITQKLVHGFR